MAHLASNRRRWQSRLALGTAMAMSAWLLLACSAGSGPSSNSSGPLVVDVLDLGTVAPGSTDQSQIFADANKIIKQKIGVTVDFNVIQGSDYPTKTQTALSAGTPVDLMYAANWLGGTGFTEAAEKGAFRPLNSLLQKYGKGILGAEPSYMIQSGAIKGKIYGVGPLQNYTLDPSWDLQKRTLHAAGVTQQPKGGLLYLSGSDGFRESNISSILAAANGHLNGTASSFTMLGYTGGGPGGDFDPMAYGYWPTDPSVHAYAPFYVQMGTTKVTMGLSALRSFADMMRQWYLAGYMPKDVGTNGNPPTLPSAQFGADFDWTGGGDIQSADALSAGMTPSEETISVPLSPRPFFTGYNGGWSMPTTGHHPVQSMKLLNLFFTDPKLVTLLSYGISGKDYSIQDDTIQPTKSASYVESCWIWGNCFTTPTWPYSAGSPADGPNFWPLTKQWTQSAIVSPLSGFTFDTQAVSSAWDQLQAASQRYWLQLFTGSVDVNQVFPQFVAALNAAGAGQIMKAMQQQLDSYLKAHPQDRADLLKDTYQRLMSESPVVVHD